MCFKRCRRVFLIKVHTMRDSARSGLHYMLPNTVQVRQMNERWGPLLKFQNFMREESMFLNEKD